MQIAKGITKIFSWAWFPIKKNAMLMLFMYILGIAVALSELPTWKGAKLYGNLWLELFADLYAICILLCLFPDKIRRWCHLIVYAIAYPLAIIDVFCWVRFGSSISPSMLLLVGETTDNEATEFLYTYVTPDLLTTYLGWILLILLCHILVTTLPKWRKVKAKVQILRDKMPVIDANKQLWIQAYLGMLVASLLVIGWNDTYKNKKCIHRFYQCKTVGDVEKDMNKSPHAEMYQPIYRLISSIFSNELVAKQLVTLKEEAEKVERMSPEELGIDTCQFKSDNIVLIIGESYNRQHSQLYG